MRLPQKATLSWVAWAAASRMRSMVSASHYNVLRRLYDIDPSFWFNGAGANLYGEGRIICGARSYIGAGTTIEAAPGRTVRIGEGCAISHAVRIYTQSRNADYDLREHHPVEGDVTIGDFVWIGAGVFITPGTTIGDQAVVGANSVVTHDVDPWTIVGGVPARAIRRKRHAPEGLPPA